ncbi:hypothetical protein MNBD_GAMMA08-2248 [hydrothermal vent metagenome]|uniref:Lipoprotein n=1 Tax=hydrothermal vent metagenome TaxID=652676 RepID=A0A3B0X0V8_9ZZZZ
MKKIAITTFVASTIVLMSGCGSSNGNTPGGVDADPISIVTVEGAQHVLTGVHTTGCYASDGGGRIDRLTVTGTEWTNESDLYADDTCTSTPNRTGKLIGNISKVDDILISGWRGQGDVAPQRADGTGSLSNNEVVSPFNIEITAVIDPTQVFGGGLSIGFQITAFYVFDDTAGAGTYIMYRDDDGAFASASDPYVLNANAGSTFSLPSVAISGDTIELANTSWVSNCYLDGLTYLITSVNYSETAITIVINTFSDVACANPIGEISYGGDLTNSTLSTISSWGGESAPQKQDGSGDLTATENYTQYTLTITASSIEGEGGISIGETFLWGYVVDDSVALATALYGVDNGTAAATGPLFIQGQ